mmetsp:Transcript_72345/g.125432  ORF Transcript_72345/g.125432 Transcript_72345/m.125432 type:complete len:349 (+) Transcript_72345:137-1183(+)
MGQSNRKSAAKLPPPTPSKTGGDGGFWNAVPCCNAADMKKTRTQGTGSTRAVGGPGSTAGMPAGATGSHSMLRSGPLTQLGAGPKLYEFILLPWACAVVILLLILLSEGCSKTMVFLPSMIIMGVCIAYGYKRYKQRRLPEVGVAGLCAISCLAAFIIGMIIYVHFLKKYCGMKGGASYFNVLPSESPMAHADMTSMVFATGTSADSSRTYGYVDGNSATGTIYCVAPMSNEYTAQEAGVSYFAAGTNCCNARSNFQCGEAGSNARGALMLAQEDDAPEGFKKAVEGAQYAYNLLPMNGYLLVRVVRDPVAVFNGYWKNSVKLVLVYLGVYLLISCMIGYMAHRAFMK